MAAEFGFAMVELTAAGTPALGPWGVASLVALLLVVAAWTLRRPLGA